LSARCAIRDRSRWRIFVMDGPYAGEYPSVVDGVSDDGKTVAVGMPFFRAEAVPIPVGTRVYVQQIGGAMYEFETVVAAHRPGAIPLLIMKMPDRVKRVQRRNHFRMDMTIGIVVEIIERDGSITLLKNARLRDLSAGGVGLLSKTTLQRGTIVRVSLPFLEKKALGEVVRVRPNGPEDTPASYCIGIRFVGPGNRQTTRITRVIFEEQMDLRRRGLL